MQATRPPYHAPTPSAAEVLNGKPWRWYINEHDEADGYISVRYSREQQAVLCCVNGKRVATCRPIWRFSRGSMTPQQQLRIAAKKTLSFARSTTTETDR